MQNSLFEIHVEWLPKQSSLSPDARLARISIVLNGVFLTKNTNLFDNTQPDFLVAAPYPMALWFLDNWWRLCFEPTPDLPTTDWRMSHVLSAAGFGYSWPTIGFQSDSQNITISSIPTLSADVGSARFCNAYTSSIPLDTFATTIFSFIKNCLLHAADADLNAIYTAIQSEQADIELACYRTLEAMLGFDAGQGNEDRLTHLLHLALEYDTQTVRELSRFLYDRPALEQEMQAVRKGEIGSTMDISSLNLDSLQVEQTLHPWDTGYALAQQVRCLWQLNGPVSNETLCERVSLQAKELDRADRDDALGLGVRREDALFSFTFAKRSRASTRFMFARALCDAILSRKGHGDFLTMTPSKTARQKMQRAFAAELLCPILDILQETDSVNDKDAIDFLAEKYGVNARLVESQLANHGYGQRARERKLWFPETVLETVGCA
ncbi:MAG: hypothetical protein J5846_10575 [Desulfovibrio sp.]|nr:hypothetical protein [Desulfovibrio sp.]